jgi:hypothetical protein
LCICKIITVYCNDARCTVKLQSELPCQKHHSTRKLQ